MLNESDEQNLTRLLENVEMEIAGQPSYDISFNDILWLAKKLKELNDFLKLIEAKSNKFDSLDDRAIFNKAKQLLMDVHGLNEGKAYRFLIDTSMKSQKSKITIAKQIIEELDLT